MGQKSTPQSDLKELKRFFDILDTNNDGHLSRDEIKEMFRVAGFNLTKKELENTMSVMDSDKNCEIDFNEFVKIMEASNLSRDPEKQSKELLEAFERFDLNGDGLIDKEEFKRIMKLGDDPVDEDLDKLWAQWDKNGDGFLQYTDKQKILRLFLSSVSVSFIGINDKYICVWPFTTEKEIR